MPKPTKADTDLLKTARLRWKQAEEADKTQRDREKIALGFYAGDQWPEDIIRARQGQAMNQGASPPAVGQPVPARPTITINLVREPVRQILNQERQADLGIELIPADDFGNLAQPINEEEIELREGLIRRIQRDSEAGDARSWAFSRAVIAGRGYYGVMTRYAPGKTADQEIYVERFYDQNGVRLDPFHEQPDGSDANWGFTGTDTMPFEEYKALNPSLANGRDNPLLTWGKAEFKLLDNEEREWFTFKDDSGIPTHVRMVNYYFAEWEGRELAMFPDGYVSWVNELSEDVPKNSYETRRVAERSIQWVKTDGVNILDQTDWPGHYIPIIKVVGEELQPYDQERRCEGVVDPAIQPGRAFNYMVSKLVETIGLSPIPQWILASGQDEGFEAEWDGINTRTLGRVHYNVKDSEGNPVGMPQRISAQTDVQAIAGSVQMFMEAVQKVMASPDPALGHVDPTIKSGKLAKLLIDRGVMGNSHYLDNLARSMRHEARIENDLLYPIYGKRPGRLMRMMTGNGESQSVLLGRPMTTQNGQPQPAQPGQPGAKTYQLTPDVEFTVTAKIGKNYDTRRQEVADFLVQLVAADPALMQVYGDLLLKMQDVPMANELADRMKAMLAPPVQALLEKDAQQAPIPPQVQAQMAQMQQALQELQPLADKNRADLTKTKMQEDAEMLRTQAKIESDERAAALDNLVKLAIAEIGAQTQGAKIEAEMARTELGFKHSHQESEAGRMHEAHESMQDRTHEATEAAVDRIQTSSESAQDRAMSQNGDGA